MSARPQNLETYDPDHFARLKTIAMGDVALKIRLGNDNVYLQGHQLHQNLNLFGGTAGKRFARSEPRTRLSWSPD